MSILSLRFSKLPDGRLIDEGPMEDGGPALVFDPRTPGLGWLVFDGTFADLTEAAPLTVEEERELVGDSDE